MADRKKVYFFSSIPFDKVVSGGAKINVKLLKTLRQLTEVDVIKPHVPDRLIAEVHSPRVRVVKNVLFLASQLVFQAGMIPSIMKNRRNAIIVAFDVYPYPFPHLLSKFLGIPLIYFASDYGDKYRRHISKSFGPMGKLHCTIFSRAEKKFISQSSAILCPSINMAERISEQSNPKADLLVFPYFDRPSQVDPRKVSDFRNRHNLHGKKVVTFVGGTDYPDNLESAQFIIEKIAAPILNRRNDMVFILAGNGTEKLVAESDQGVLGLGYVEDLDTLLYSSDVGIVPNQLPGGISTKGVDYLSHGVVTIACPQIAGNLPRSNLVISCRREFMAEKIEDTADRISRLYSDAELWRNAESLTERWDEEINEFSSYMFSMVN